MGGGHRRRDPDLLTRKRTAKGRNQPARERLSRERRNSWFAALRASVEEDRSERGEPADLVLDEVLAWADAFHMRTGQWPTFRSGPIPEAPGETWLAVEAALSLGLRGFPGGSTIPRLLDEYRGQYNPKDPHFTIEQILAWADAFHGRTGLWPIRDSGPIPDAPGIHWGIIDLALRRGRGGLPASSSLARLLSRARGVIHRLELPRLTEEQILNWADEFRNRTGSWPTLRSGPIPGAASGDTWAKIDRGLKQGNRGLPGGNSLARLLIDRRGARNMAFQSPLSYEQVHAWADAYRRRTGEWPGITSGPIPDAPGETWQNVNSALTKGLRGLPGGSSLSRLFGIRRRGKIRNHPRPLSIPHILAWADAFHARTGRWPRVSSGPIQEAAGEDWRAVHNALYKGRRGLPGGSSLARLLARERGRRNEKDLPPLLIPEILRWADAHHARTGRWPHCRSGPIPEAPGETWMAVESALSRGGRGFAGGSSLTRLLVEQRGIKDRNHPPHLTIPQILVWADGFHGRTGRWPTVDSGPIPEARGETWGAVQVALYQGQRGLPGGSSLSRLLAQERDAYRGRSRS